MKHLAVVAWILTGYGCGCGGTPTTYPATTYTCESFVDGGAECITEFQTGKSGACHWTCEGPDCELFATLIGEAVAGCWATQ